MDDRGKGRRRSIDQRAGRLPGDDAIKGCSRVLASVVSAERNDPQQQRTQASPKRVALRVLARHFASARMQIFLLPVFIPEKDRHAVNERVAPATVRRFKMSIANKEWLLRNRARQTSRGKLLLDG